MIYYLSAFLQQYWGPFRLLQSHALLLAGGAFTAALLTWLLLPHLWNLLPRDRGKALLKDLGGMGDLLAGVIGARWAYLKGDPFEAAAASVWLHGAASDALVAAGGDPSIVNTAARLGSLRVTLDQEQE